MLNQFDKMNEYNDRLKLSVLNMRIGDLINDIADCNKDWLSLQLQADFESLTDQLAKVHEGILHKIGTSVD
jgi:hypothetical protein